MRRLLPLLLSLVLAGIGAGLAAEAPAAATAPTRPNVLFIGIDDLRTSLGCYGDPRVKSPHLDRLAQGSRLFLRAYTHQAVCGPARAALLTGRLPDNTRVWHNRNTFRATFPDLVTLPQLFKNHGYQALSMGKIFSGDERELDPVSWSAPEILRQTGWKNYHSPKEGAGKGAPYEAADVPDEGYPDGKLATLAIEALERLQGTRQPFFLAVGFYKPHLPFNAPKKYWDLYDPAALDLPPGQARPQGAPDIAYHTHRELGGYRDVPEDERVTAAQARTLRHGYHACVSYVDAQVGRVLEALQRLGLDRNTIVVVWGDHGFALGETDRWCKGTNFEIDTRVPLLIRTPGLARPGAPTEALVEYVDVYPTLAELAGLRPPGPLDGRSLVPLLQDPAARGRDAVLSQFTRPWTATGFTAMGYSLRTATQRYTRWVEWPSRRTRAEELYDYALTDGATREGAYLLERRNLIEHPDYAAARGQLRARMDEMLRTRLAPETAEAPAATPAKAKKKKKNA
jgi:iduronate 2-sulfatase